MSVAKKYLMLVATILAAVMIAEVASETGNQTAEPEDLARTRDNNNNGLILLFDMIKFFLNEMVMPKTIGDLIEEYEIETFSDFTTEEFLDEWQSWILYFLGFLICIAVGILFILVMIFCGCCCCCRNCCKICCCCCCKKKRKKSSRCKRICYGTLTFLVTTMMFVSVVVVFMTNDMVTYEVSEHGMLQDIKEGVYIIDMFLDESVDDMNVTLLQELHHTSDEIFVLLKTLPAESFQRIEEEYRIGAMLQDLGSFIYDMEDLSRNLSQMFNSTIVLINQTEEMEKALAASRAGLDPLLSNCTYSNISSNMLCSDALHDLDKLASNATYDNLTTGEVKEAEIFIDLAIENGIVEAFAASKAAYLEVRDEVDNQTEAEIQEIEEAVNDILKEVDEGFESFSDGVDDIAFETAYDGLDTAQGYLEQYSPYYTIPMVVLTVLFLLIVVFNGLGLLFGGLCPRPHEKDGYCSRTTHQGANWLVVGVICTFLFTWFFMLVTTVHFTLGGATETLLCRHLVTYDETMQEIEELIKVELDVDYNISFRDALEHCKDDETLYVASNLENNGYNISELLDLEQYGIYEAVDDLQNVTVDFGDVIFLEESLNYTLITISGLLHAVDYQGYYDELAKSVTQTDLLAYADDLDVIVIELNASGHFQLAEKIEEESKELRSIYYDYVEPMEKERDVLKEAVMHADKITHSQDLDELLLNLTHAQHELNIQGGEVVTDVLVEYGEITVTLIEDYAEDADEAIRYEVAQCRPVFDAAQTIVYGPCLYFLEPFNSVWFLYGWYLFFSVPCLIFAAILAGLYRIPKRKEFPGASYSSRSNLMHNFEMNEAVGDYTGDPPSRSDMSQESKKYEEHKKSHMPQPQPTCPPPDYHEVVDKKTPQYFPEPDY